jgi:hypothetical protein
MSTGQSAGRRSEMSRLESSCLCVGTNFSWFAWIWASMVVLGCESMDCVLHGESSQAGRIKTTRRELWDVVEEATACRTALRISSCSYSGLLMQDSVSR